MQSDTVIRLDIHRPIRYRWGGLFVAPNADWIHMQRRLTDFEFFVMQRGTLYIMVDEQEYELNEGECLLTLPNSRQCGSRPTDCSFYWMHFVTDPMDGYEKFKNTLNYEPGYLLLHEHATLTSAPRVHSMMQLLVDTERRYSDQEANSFLATAVLCEVQNQLRTALHLHNEKETLLFEAINDYISRHIGERLHVKDVAEYFGYNEKYLTTLFREKTGTSLKAHIISQKMERAKFLLCNTSAAISEISYNLSYWDEQSFSSAFKRFTGMSPTEYRRMYSAGLVNHV
ncbi:MAG: AraC family transcriptional regulator [Lachnospiraceae bacterium]|nr:AraC family transcriptional regulator [Lachnospiraceae bacterium]